MARMVKCVKLGREAEGLDFPPYPGELGKRIYDNVSKEGITRDLEAMARVGIGRAYIGHIFDRRNEKDTPVGKVQFMSDAWWDALQWAVKEADRCGVEIGFFNAPGWSQSGGPWIKPSESMRYLGYSETEAIGGKTLEIKLPAPVKDPSFDAFRKQLGEAAAKKDRAALSRLVVAQGFFWDGEKGDQAKNVRPA